MSSTPRCTQFAIVLREAMRAGGLTLESVQRRLEAVGVRVARSTLSFWQTGQRVPTGSRSLVAVRHLETILQVPEGSLVKALVTPEPFGPLEDLAVLSSGSRLEELIDEVGCAGRFESAEVVAVQDFATVRADGSLDQVLNILTIRALTDIDRYPGIHGGEPGGDPDRISFEVVSGGRVGRVARDHALTALVCEVVFDRVVPRGEHHVIRRITHDGNVVPIESAYLVGGAVNALVSLEVEFHPDRMPVAIEEFERQRDTAPDRFSRRVSHGTDRRVRLLRERPRRGVVGLRWVYE
ncbi:MAG TPA: hypothetical protein P5181_05725 [Dermatophilaceae bacterium]|nr:hypothetical protein [Dermatophilaceae bacterium]